MTRDCSCRSHCSLYSCRRDGIGPQTCVNDFSLVPKFCCKAGEEAASALPVEYRVMQAAALKVICLTDVAVSTRKEQASRGQQTCPQSARGLYTGAALQEAEQRPELFEGRGRETIEVPRSLELLWSS